MKTLTQGERKKLIRHMVGLLDVLDGMTELLEDNPPGNMTPNLYASSALGKAREAIDTHRRYNLQKTRKAMQPNAGKSILGGGFAR